MCKRLNIQEDRVFLLVDLVYSNLPAAVSVENVCVGFPRALSSFLLSKSLLADQRHCANRQRRRQEIMVSEKFYLRLLTFVTLLTVLALSGNFFLPFFLLFPPSFFLALCSSLCLSFKKCLLKVSCSLDMSEV